MYNLVTKLIELIAHAGGGNQFLSGGIVLGLIGSLTYYLKSVPRQLYDLFMRHCTVVVDVTNTAPSYYWLFYWMESQAYSKKSRRVSVKHIKMKDGGYKVVFVPARGNHVFWYKNRLLWLNRKVDKDGTAAPGSVQDMINTLDPKEILSIRVLGRSRNFLNDLIEEARKMYEASDEGMLHIHRFQWGDWKKFMKPKRPMESIFLPNEATNIVKDMRNFIGQETWYRRMGIPYRKGYLFTGPPGTGKSSSVEALAGELGIPLYILNLAYLGDSSLETAMIEMDNMGTAIILIEDVDTVQISRDHTNQTQKISLGTLLNVLDGVQAADNVILVMTSNHAEKLDPALTRKGRVDQIIHFGLASEEQIQAAVNRFLPHVTLDQKREVASWTRPLSMAEVQENLKQMVLSPDRANQERLEFACLN